jgi:hypothetical protein
MAAFTNSTAPGSDFGGRARRLVSVYVNRRLPWGTPWWIDAVALGAANVVRQFVVPDVADSIELAIFVAMVGVVFAAVTVVHTRLWRRAAEPSSNQRRQRPEAATPIVDQPAADGPTRRWAPWWWYAVSLLGATTSAKRLSPGARFPSGRWWSWWWRCPRSRSPS